jgi:hypothetical protein
LCPWLTADGQTFREFKFDERVKTGDMVKVKVADKQEHRFFLGYVTICLRDSVTRIKDDIVFFRLDKH